MEPALNLVPDGSSYAQMDHLGEIKRRGENYPITDFSDREKEERQLQA